ncbi:MAG: methylated-DNA--[protein]-cysteine S-methyltransferase [Sedimentisphaerales bacterium]|nr:methylated-DNA--[protein]-cysteine S-methyltransferase [Sedimentisphaerales bacterium]
MAKKPQPVYYTIFNTEWGCFGLAANEDGLIRTCLPSPNPEKIKARLLKNLPAARYSQWLFNPIRQLIIAYFLGTRINFFTDVPLVLDGLSPFARRVLMACRKIQFGQTVSYLELAKKVQCPSGSRAVAGALAKNPLPLIIPCHRVICANGSLGGFSASGGVELKERLLKLEAGFV